VLPTTGLSPTFGVKVDIDLTESLSTSHRHELRRLLSEHYLLFIEAPDLTLERQIEVAGIFGRVIPTSIDPRIETMVSNTRADGYLGTQELEWHTDATFLVEPFRAAVLFALDLQAGASATRFISAVRAVERLPGELRAKLRFLQVFNTTSGGTEGVTSSKMGKRLATFGSDLPCAVHPLIAKHPVTGAEYLTPNSYHSDAILGMNCEESQVLLSEIYHHFYSTDEIYEHWWKNGDLVIWDNLAVYHSRADVSKSGPRTLRRVSAGIATFAEQIPPRQYADYERDLRARQRAQAAASIVALAPKTK
jgi:taurine dioxygenase